MTGGEVTHDRGEEATHDRGREVTHDRPLTVIKNPKKEPSIEPSAAAAAAASNVRALDAHEEAIEAAAAATAAHPELEKNFMDLRLERPCVSTKGDDPALWSRLIVRYGYKLVVEAVDYVSKRITDHSRKIVWADRANEVLQQYTEKTSNQSEGSKS